MVYYVRQFFDTKKEATAVEYLSHNETETEALGARLAAVLTPGSVVAYQGGLGMG